MTSTPPLTLPSTSSQMLQMLNAFLTVQALHVAAALRIADHLAERPRGVDELATIKGAHRSSLYRLLRMLTGAGVFREEVGGQFALTPLGTTLRSEGPDSVRDWALFVGAPEMWQVWGSLREPQGCPRIVAARRRSTGAAVAAAPAADRG